MLSAKYSFTIDFCPDSHWDPSFGYGLPTPDFGLPTSVFRLRSSDSGLPTPVSRPDSYRDPTYNLNNHPKHEFL